MVTGGGAQVESAGVVGRIGDRFPLAAPLGVVLADGTAAMDGPWTPFGMTTRVVPADPLPVDLTGVRYDEASQTSVWPVHVRLRRPDRPRGSARQTRPTAPRGRTPHRMRPMTSAGTESRD
jgi:hypothetical protein